MRSLPFYLSLAVLLGAIIAVIMEPPFVSGLRNASFDTFQQWKPREYRKAPVRIIDIDEKSLEKHGQWPDDPGVADMVKRLPDHDRLFASAIGKGSVVTGFSVEPKGSSSCRPGLKMCFCYWMAECFHPILTDPRFFPQSICKKLFQDLIISFGHFCEFNTHPRRLIRQAAFSFYGPNHLALYLKRVRSIRKLEL